MIKKVLIDSMVGIADTLDELGFLKEAEVLDGMMVKMASDQYPMSEFDPKGVEREFWDRQGEGVPEQYRHRPGETAAEAAYDPVRDKGNPLFYSGYDEHYTPFDALKDEMKARGVDADNVKYWKPEYSRYYSGGQYHVPEAYQPDEYDEQDNRGGEGTGKGYEDKTPGRSWTSKELSNSKYTPTSLAGQSSGVRPGPSQWEMLHVPKAADFFKGPSNTPYAIRSSVEDALLSKARSGAIQLPSWLDYLKMFDKSRLIQSMNPAFVANLQKSKAQQIAEANKPPTAM